MIVVAAVLAVWIMLTWRLEVSIHQKYVKAIEEQEAREGSREKNLDDFADEKAAKDIEGHRSVVGDTSLPIMAAPPAGAATL